MKALAFVLLVVVPAPLRVHLIAPVTGRAMTVPSSVVMALAELLGLVVLAAVITLVARRSGGFRLVYFRAAGSTR